MNNALRAASAIAAQRLASLSNFRAKEGGKMVKFKPDELREAQAEAWDKAMVAAAKTAEANAKDDAVDTWEDGWVSGCKRTAKDIRALPNPFRSKTDD